MKPHLAQTMDGLEVIRGRKSRFTVIRQDEDTSSAVVDVARLARAMLTVMMLSSAAGAGGVLLVHSDEWRHHLPRLLASAVEQARTALLDLVRAAKGF